MLIEVTQVINCTLTPRYFTVLQSVIWEKSKDNPHFSGGSFLGGMIIKLDFERLRVNLFEIMHLLILLISKDIFAWRIFDSWSASNMQVLSAKEERKYNYSCHWYKAGTVKIAEPNLVVLQKQ